jgi:hypothetical protein
MRIAKWSTLTVSTAAVVYGFTQNRSADHEYEQLESLCQSDPTACERTASDEYADPALESRYQSVLRRDDHAKVALLAGQIGIAASVVLFILDLSSRSEPGDIPYNPQRFNFGFSGEELYVLLRFGTR